MGTIHRPLPTITPDHVRFWEAARAGRMELQRCNDCGRFWYYPGPVCHYCSSRDFTWTPVSGKGTIYSHTVLERAKGNPFEDDVPITIVLVRLEEGPVMMSNLIDYEPGELRIDAPVVVDYERVDDEVTLPVFRPAA
ncbi:MAG: OB-fold domain-containing protein [Microbacteriaceae bacterium]|nr:OB-fold domain-containing protein [Microbacteriaceae bacterium]